MVAHAQKYGPCPHCYALNMLDRVSCYRCNQDLKAPLGSTGDNESENDSPVVNQENRAHSRTRIHSEAVVATLDGHSRHCATVTDISVGGFQLRTEVPYNSGSRLLVTIPFHGATIALIGTSCRCVPVVDEEGSRYATGIKYEDINPSAFRLLTEPFEV